MGQGYERGHRRDPLDRPIFPNRECPHQPQEVPTGTVFKDKWDPDESKFRIVNDYKKNGQNDSRGEWEELETIYYQVKHLIMIILLLGMGTIVVLWDVQVAYRT